MGLTPRVRFKDKAKSPDLALLMKWMAINQRVSGRFGVEYAGTLKVFDLYYGHCKSQFQFSLQRD